MDPRTDPQRIKAHLLIWWILWASILAGLCVIYTVLGRSSPLPPPSSADLLVNLAGFVPLFLSVVIRWLVLPRYREPARALVIFIVGLSLAEACGMMGIFLGGPYRDALFLLGVFGITQYVPLYARRLYEPRSSGFRPNN